MSQSLTTGGTTVKTRYVLGLEEQTGDVSKQPLTKYESVAGVCDVVITGTGSTESISYVTTDGLGSVSEALDGNGNVTAQQLYGPYGGVRYSSGTMPTAKGYTGQYADATTGLDYYGARYYDPLAGQFISADSVAAGGLNRYAYVRGNPETATDPTGHVFTCVPDCSGGGGSGGTGGTGGNGTCTSNCGGGCHSDASCGCYTGSCSGPSLPHCTSNCAGSPCGGCNARTYQSSAGDNCLNLGCATKEPFVSFYTCTDDQDCLYGDDPGGLLSLISGEIGGKSPNWITAVGDKGLQWLIGVLEDVKSAGDSIFAQWEQYAGLVGTVSGIAGAPAISAAAATVFGNAWVDQQNFDHMLDDLITPLKGLDYAYSHGQAAWVNTARFVAQTYFDPCPVCIPGGIPINDERISVQTWIFAPMDTSSA